MENIILDPNLIFAAGEKIINERDQECKKLSNIIIQEIMTLTRCGNFLVSKIENSNNYKYVYQLDINRIEKEKYKINSADFEKINSYINKNNICACYKKFNILPASKYDDYIFIEFELEDPKIPHIK